MNKLMILLLLGITIIFVCQCTPDNTSPLTEPSASDPVYQIKLWTTLDTDTFKIYDTTSVLRLYADITKDSLIIADSTEVKFYVPYGRITDKSYTDGGQAKAEYSAILDSSSVFTGKLAITASFAVDRIYYDTLHIFVKNCMTKK